MIAVFLDELKAALGGDTPRASVHMSPAAPGRLEPPAVYLTPNGREIGTLGAPVADRWRAVAAVTWQPEAGFDAIEALSDITDALVKAAAATGAGWQRSEYLGKLLGAGGGPDALLEVHHLLFADNH